LTLILPGLIPATLLMFIGLLVGLARQRPVVAARISVETMLGSPAALLVTLLVTGVLAVVALLWGYGVGLLLFAVWATATGFVAYRDVFESGQPQSSTSVVGANGGVAE
jgi:NADH:ubiquinone oxidoreductase subunit K